jgi:hypothetical protein
MHEINTAAEAITAAADPDANIIFGATISPELEGEIIITVVATGFDAAYFSNRSRPSVQTSDMTASEPGSEPLANPVEGIAKATDADMEDVDMEVNDQHVEHSEQVADFTNDEAPATDIWKDAEGVKTHHNDKAGASLDEDVEPTMHKPVVSGLDEEELEKPSFLRRLTRRKNKDEKDDF